jgi:hypothetical protein
MFVAIFRQTDSKLFLQITIMFFFYIINKSSVIWIKNFRSITISVQAALIICINRFYNSA